MCRIFVNPNPDEIFDETAILKYFRDLEKTGGGDGNGIVLLDNNKQFHDMEKMPNPAQIEGRFIFHTRMATHGVKTTLNIQPFDGIKYVVAHNGVWHNELLGKLYDIPKDYSDSYVISKLIHELGIIKFYYKFYDEEFGVVVAYNKENGKIYLAKAGGTFQVGKDTKTNKYLYGTAKIEFWQDIKSKPMEDGLYTISENEIIPIFKPKKPRKNFSYYSYARTTKRVDGTDIIIGNANSMCYKCTYYERGLCYRFCTVVKGYNSCKYFDKYDYRKEKKTGYESCDSCIYNIGHCSIHNHVPIKNENACEYYYYHPEQDNDTISEDTTFAIKNLFD